MKNKIHTKNTLMNWSKEALVEHIMCLEHNNAAMSESFEIQYQNCVKMVDDMSLLNDGLKKARALRAGEGQKE